MNTTTKPTREQLLVLVERAGALMANTMFNLAQRAGYTLTSDDASLFDTMRRDWDNALGNLRIAGFIASGANEPDGDASAALPAATTHPPAQVPAPGDSELEYNATRLRNVARLVGLESAVPQDDATLDGARGSVLGMIAGKLRAILAASAPGGGEPRRCPHCDDTGDVHRADGEWLGSCTCEHGQPGGGEPSGRELVVQYRSKDLRGVASDWLEWTPDDTADFRRKGWAIDNIAGPEMVREWRVLALTDLYGPDVIAAAHPQGQDGGEVK